MAKSTMPSDEKKDGQPANQNKWAVFDGMLEGVQVIDFENRYLYVNDAAVIQNKISREDLIGHTQMEKYPGIEKTGIFGKIRECLEKRTPQYSENAFVFPDGSAGFYEIRVEPTPEGAIILSFDVTERKRSEEALRLVEAVVEASYDAIIGETIDGIVTSWNGGARRMLGYTSEEMIGKSAAVLYPPELQDEYLSRLERVKRGEACIDLDSVWLRKDQARVDVEMSLSPIYVALTILPLRDVDGSVTGISVVSRDITERKKAEMRIKELNEIRNKFITIISHQLRTPLTAINWNLETLLNGDFGSMEDNQLNFLRVTHDASVELTRRIHDLLTAMDVEEGRVRLEKGEMALDSTCAAVVNELMKKCGLKGLSCSYSGPANDLPPIQGDAEKVRMLVRILMENAIAYTKKDGTIIVGLARKGDAVRFEVTDTGVGIPAAEQYRIFTRFFRASNASTMQQDAFGLGLFLAKHLIERHGGKIGFTSEENKGSTFWFEIPTA